MADLNHDGQREVVAALDGNEPCVVAYTSHGSLLWRRALPDSWLMFTSLTATDVDADGSVEVVVSDGSGKLTFLEPDGTIGGSVSFDDEAWMPASFLSWSASGESRIVAGTDKTLSRRSALGSQDNGSGEFADGQLDEVRIARGARSPAYVLAQYQSMKPDLDPPFAQLGQEESP